MGFFDITSIEYEPELSGKFFRSYRIEGTPYVVVRYPLVEDMPIQSVWATRRDMDNFINTKGHRRGKSSRRSPSPVSNGL